MTEEKKIIQDDEIDLVELAKTIWVGLVPPNGFQRNMCQPMLIPLCDLINQQLRQGMEMAQQQGSLDNKTS